MVVFMKRRQLAAAALLVTGAAPARKPAATAPAHKAAPGNWGSLDNFEFYRQE